jgi:hypothetical protein
MNSSQKIVPSLALVACLFTSCGGTTESSQSGGGASAGAGGTPFGGSAGTSVSLGGNAGSTSAGGAAGAIATGGNAGAGNAGGVAGAGNAGGSAGAGNAGGLAGAAGMAAAAADGGPVSEVLCGWGICAAQTEFCCVSYQPQGSGECLPIGAAGSCTGASSVAMLCDGPEDCAGTLCCGANGSGLPFVGVIECKSSCPFDGMHTLFCQPWAPETCPNGTACKPAPLLPTYHSCQSI